MVHVRAVAVLLAGLVGAGPAAAQMSFDFQSPSFGGNNVAKRQQQLKAAKRTNPFKADQQKSPEERLNESIRSRARREIADQIVDDNEYLGGLGEFKTRTEDDKGFVQIPGADGSTIEIQVPKDTDFWRCLTGKLDKDDPACKSGS